MRFLACVVLAVAPLSQAAVAQEGAAARDRMKVRELLQQAAAAEEIGNAAEAEALLRAALDVDAGDVDALTALGRFLCANDGGAEGLALLYRAFELEPTHLDATAALIDVLLADRDWYFEQGDSGNADACVERAHEVLERAARARAEAAGGGGAPRIRELDLRRVCVLSLREEGGKEAFALAVELVGADPTDEELHAALVDAATAAKEFDAAIAWYEQADLPPWLEAWFTAAVRAARATWNFNHYTDDEQAVQDYLAADRLVLESARLRPEIFDAASERSSFYRSWAGWVRFTRQQLTEEAWELFMSAWGRNPANPNAIEGISWTCGRVYEAGDLEKARELYRQACTIAPDRWDFWNNYGLICRDTGHYEESFRAYRRAMELAPEDGRIVNDCALILFYHLHRDLDLAERWFIQAEDLARARMEQARADEDEGLEGEQRLVLGDALVNLARLYSEQGRMQEAAEHWDELRAVDPTRPELPESGGRPNLPPPPGSRPPPEGGGDGAGGRGGGSGSR